jgi:hypothetical protein
VGEQSVFSLNGALRDARGRACWREHRARDVGLPALRVDAFDPSIVPGTVVRFAAWADEASSDCTNGALLAWDLAVGGGTDGGPVADAGWSVLSAVMGMSFVYWENRVWQAGGVMTMPLAESSYQSVAQTALYTANFSIDATMLTLTSVSSGGPSYVGTLVPSSSLQRPQWDLKAFAGGTFTVWAAGTQLNADVTIFGSGVPVVSSNRGVLLPPQRH